VASLTPAPPSPLRRPRPHELAEVEAFLPMARYRPRDGMTDETIAIVQWFPKAVMGFSPVPPHEAASPRSGRDHYLGAG
jgi:hypothetical protein